LWEPPSGAVRNSLAYIPATSMEELRGAELLQKDPHILNLVRERALGVAVRAFQDGLLPEPAHGVE
jgi:hypothetical protein